MLVSAPPISNHPASEPTSALPLHRGLRLPHALALIAGAAGALVPACANPEALAPIAAQHASTLDALQAHVEASHVLLERQVDAAIEIQHVALTGRLHRELLALGLMTPDFEPMVDQLEAHLGDADANAALLEEVRVGRLSLEAAQAWLGDYALACRMAKGADARRALLARLAPVEALDASAAALRSALQGHGDAVLALVAELRADTQAIDAFARQGELTPTWDRARTRELIETHVLSRIEGEQRRAAAAELLDLLLQPWPASLEGGAS